MKDQVILIYSYLLGIWQYRWSALVISSLVAFISWAVIYAMPNQYKSQAIINVDTRSVMKPLLKGLAVDASTVNGLDIMSQVLLSRSNLENVIRQTDLGLQAKDSAVMGGLVMQLARSAKLQEVAGGRRKNNNNNLYKLSYRGDSPEIVYQVTSKLLNTLIESTLDSARTDTVSAQLFLDKQIETHDAKLSSAENTLAEFKRANIGYMPDEKGGYYSKLQREEGMLETVRSELRLATRKHSAMLKQLEGESPLLDNNSYGSAKVLKLRRYREQLEDLLTQFTEEHPDVQALRSTMADVMADKNVTDDEFVDVGTGDSVEFNPVYQELKAESHRASIEVETLKIRFTEQKNKVASLKQAVDILPGVEAKLVKLNRDYEITRERYLSLVARRESARLAQEVGLSGNNINFRIIEPPRLPTKPSGPDRLLLLSMAFFGAMAAGLGWGFFRYLIRPTFIDVSQIRNTIGLPILGSIGLFVTAQHKKRRRIQLTFFLLIFSLLIASYVVVIMFREFGSDLAHVLMALRAAA